MQSLFFKIKNSFFSSKISFGTNFGLANRIYFDHASATPIVNLAKSAFSQTLEKTFANSSSIHKEGEDSKEVLSLVRKKIAKCLHSKPGNIYFTSSTTEANNIFIKGLVLEELNKGNEPVHIIYSKSDHSAIVDVVEACKNFSQNGRIKFTNIIPNKIGLLEISEILKNITKNTKLICFSHVHSELGTIQEVKKIVQAVQEFWKKNFPELKSECPKIFIDGSQAVKYESIDVGNLLVDGMSFGGNKMGSVAGAAVLYIKPGVKILPLISGGGQEDSVRSGTENLGAIVALSNILEQVANPILQKEIREKVYGLRNYCILSLRENFKEEELEIFGDTKFKYNKFYENSAPHILLISLVGCLGEETCLRLDAKGISVSTATACSLLENSGSNFLKSIGEPVKAKETIRLSFSDTNTKEEIDYFVKVLKDIKNKFV